MTMSQSSSVRQIVLRNYQKEAVDNVLEAIENGIKRPAIVLATGGGKTIVLSSLIPRLMSGESLRKKILILCHKEELVRQAHATVSEMCPNLKVQIDMHKCVPTEDADVIVGSVMTLVRLTRLHKYDPLQFRALILDECHHATASSWTKILNYFGALEDDSDILVLGFTATFERSDGTALNKVFERIVFERSLRTMVENKELCDVKFSTISVDLDLSKVRRNMGDYVATHLSKAVNVSEINLRIALSYKELKTKLGFKSTLIFCVDIEHCKTLCGVFQENGVNAQYVTGETVKYERQAILEDFKNGKIDVLCNVLVFTEGTDIPNIDSLILARPTKSRPLLVQMIGRGLRLHKDKLYCHVIDMVGTVNVGVLSIPTLFGVDDLDWKGKTLLEVEKEAEDARVELEEKRKKDVDDLLKIQEGLAGIDLNVATVEGFAALEVLVSHRMQDFEDISRKFMKSRLQWLRLEYDIWACNIPTNRTYYTIERVVEDGIVQGFQLNKNEFASQAALIASSFKCSRSLTTMITTGSLDHVLAVADNTIHLPKNIKVSTKSVTHKQIEFLWNKLSDKVASKYEESGLIRFEKALKELTLARASDLIFASLYSVNCMWVKWELSRMLGLRIPKKKASVRKSRKKKVETSLQKP